MESLKQINGGKLKVRFLISNKQSNKSYVVLKQTNEGRMKDEDIKQINENKLKDGNLK